MKSKLWDKYKIAVIITIIGIILILVLTNLNSENIIGKILPQIGPVTQIANPASTNCIELGGTLETKNDQNGEYAICKKDEEECEEWALFKGECEFENMPKCVPKTCCHPTECVLEGQQDKCEDTICTMECRAGTLDCGFASCTYVLGKCEVVQNE